MALAGWGWMGVAKVVLALGVFSTVAGGGRAAGDGREGPGARERPTSENRTMG